MTTRLLLALLFGSLTSLTQADPSRIQAIQDLANAKTFGAWRQIFAPYPSEPVEVQREIQRLLPKFADDFGVMLRAMPERADEFAVHASIGAAIDQILQRLDRNDISKRELDELKIALDAVIERYKAADLSKALPLVQVLAKEYVSILASGHKSPDPEVRRQSHDALFELASHFDPVHLVWRELCGGVVTPETKFHQVLDEAITKHYAWVASNHAKELLPLVAERREGYDGVATALAEQRVAGIRPFLLQWLRSKNEEVVEAGYKVAMAWPTSEALPLILARLVNKPGEWSVPDRLLVRYGTQTTDALRSQWTRLSTVAKCNALDALSGLPCRATLDVLSMAIQDREPSVRESAAQALGGLDDAEWDPEFSGPDPKDYDSAHVRALTLHLIGDPNPAVRAQAIGAFPFRNDDLANLIALAKDPSPEVREAVARSLGSLKSAGSVDALWAFLSDVHDVRECALTQLRYTPEAAMTHARKGLDSSNPFIREASVEVLSQLETLDRIDWIKRLATDKEASVQKKVWEALQAVGDDAVGALVEIGSRNDQATRNSADALLRIESEESMRGLTRLLAFAKGETRNYLLEVQVKLRKKLAS